MSTDKWKRENTVQILLRVTRLSGIPDALRNMTEKTGIPASVYIRDAVTEKLKRDGFLTGNSMPEQ